VFRADDADFFRVFPGLFGYVSSAVTRPDITAFSERVRSENFESMNRGLPKGAAANRHRSLYPFR